MKLFIPGPITGVVGPQGKGKSLVALKLALKVANERKLKLCLNFRINLNALYHYCAFKNYVFLISEIIDNKIEIRQPLPLSKFLTGKEEDRGKMFIYDEAAVGLNSRKFKQVDDDFMNQLTQVRHDHQLFWWIAQSYDIVDKQMRDLTQSVVQADSLTIWSDELQNFKIWILKYFIYTQADFEIYFTRVRNKCRGLKHYMRQRQLSFYQHSSPLSQEDKFIFKIYDSFGAKVGDKIKRVDSFEYQRNYRKISTGNEIELENKKDTIELIKKINNATKKDRRDIF